MHKLKKLTLLFCTALALNAAHAQSYQYALDPSFGVGGISTYPLGSSPELTPFAASVQADGKILVAGSWSNPPDYYNDSALVYRLKANGTPDSTFGLNGYATPWLNNGPYPNAEVLGIKALSNGKVAIVGVARVGTQLRGILAVLTATGQLDPVFNGGAILDISNPGVNSTWVGSVVEQGSGKLVTVASTPSAFFPVFSATMRISRYNTNGTPDATFGTGGNISITPGYSDQLMLYSNDRIWANYINGSMSGDIVKAIYRFTANGQPDTTWGTAGKSDTIMENTGSLNAYAASMIRLDNGNMILSALGDTGTGTLPTVSYHTHRFNSAGHKDVSYGTGGTVVIPVSGFDAQSYNYWTVPNGNKVITMLDQPSPTVPGTRDYVLMQTDTAGAPDASFGPSGMLRTNIGGDGNCLFMTKAQDKSIIGTIDLFDMKGEVMKFKATPTGIALINNKLEAGIFPNPATTAFTLRCESGILYAVYDATGRAVLQGKAGNKQTVVSTEALVAGVYTLICTDGKRNIEIRLVKN